jgi:hypothetical protein
VTQAHRRPPPPTATANKLRWFLHENDPELPVPSRGLRRLCVFDSLEATLLGSTGVLLEITLDLIRECRRLTERINALEGQLRRVVRQLAPTLLAVPGCGVLGAAAILGETAGAARFKSKHAFAHFNGTAPIPGWSSNKVRVRLNRDGNRTINNLGLRLVGGRAGADQPCLVGDDDGLDAVAESELGEDAGDVGLDGRLGQVEAGGEFGVAQSSGQQAEYLQFARGE